MKHFLLYALLLWAGTAQLAAQTSAPSADDFWQRMPLLPDNGLSAGQFSSKSRHQQNGDTGNYLYNDEHGDAVIFEAYGPGCVRSMWGTAFDPEAVLRFYFDGEQKPRYEVNVFDFYQGRHPAFPAPFTSYERRGYYIAEACAGNSFLPIRFQKSLRISMKGKPTFYHILYDKLPYGSEVAPGQEQRDKDFIRQCLEGKTDPQQPADATHETSTALKPWQTVDLLRHDGSGSVQSLEIEADTSSLFLRDVQLMMIWDDANSNPADGGGQRKKLAFERNEESRLFQVNTPIGMFFGSPHRVQSVQSLPVSVTLLPGGRMKLSCRFVMPFWKNARICLYNKSDVTFNNVRSTVLISGKEYPYAEAAYFTTFYRQGLTEYGRDWQFCDVQGCGWFMGAVQSCRLEHYCEGNEHFYIDGNRTPQINGTGTEDYYLGCFWPNRKYDSPFAGCVDDVRLLSGGDPDKFLEIYREDYLVPAVYYRFHLEMPIPFYNAIDARIQHGSESQLSSEYASLAYLYLKRKPVLHETDFIKIASEASRKMHRYTATGKCSPHPLTARYEGNYLYTNIEDEGYLHQDGTISFTVAIDPANRGVRLRRRSDQGIPCQKARVYVDGAFAGVWADPQQNDILRWYDSEFDIHAGLTRDKKELNIEIVPQDGCSFTDFEYRILSYK